jgi:predicted alpha/beta hydrolase family esterase
MCHGTDDPYVPLKNVQMMSEKLEVEIDMIENGGHLNSESGYTEFEYLYRKIQKT